MQVNYSLESFFKILRKMNCVQIGKKQKSVNND